MQDWVCSTLLSVQKISFSYFSPNLSQILNYQILNICRVLYVHSVRIEPMKLVLVGTRMTYQATGDATNAVYLVISNPV